jgi:hypothetical protein
MLTVLTGNLLTAPPEDQTAREILIEALRGGGGAL